MIVLSTLKIFLEFLKKLRPAFVLEEKRVYMCILPKVLTFLSSKKPKSVNDREGNIVMTDMFYVLNINVANYKCEKIKPRLIHIYLCLT